ncbi:hypothetical protein PISMIDRAFT_526939 [Pisolithus microcarpus 441]|uniref:Uncharacterized protein n=1 Tax=Pisolithus microcarpus 441 TaxID=765257 RepID=A0A0C9YW92_9AGAM|nr:hypothetical protein PISMIDRAFT_526939 [Pisolithus microcarpus 441]
MKDATSVPAYEGRVAAVRKRSSRYHHNLSGRTPTQATTQSTAHIYTIQYCSKSTAKGWHETGMSSRKTVDERKKKVIIHAIVQAAGKE